MKLFYFGVTLLVVGCLLGLTALWWPVFIGPLSVATVDALWGTVTGCLTLGTLLVLFNMGGF